MPPIARATAIAVATLVLSCASAPAWAAKAGTTRIPVTLFGQPCMLEGPLTQDTLKAVHAVSPEEICSPFSVERTPEETKGAIEKLKAATGLPSALDRYREKLTRRLKAELSFLDALPESKKSKSPAQLIEATREYVPVAKRKEFENLAKSFATVADAAKRKEVTGQIYDFYNEAIDANPEDEFHRAIRTMNVQYICSFEESDEGDSE
jgi:hypothetical protein